MGEEAACQPLARQLTFTPMSEDEVPLISFNWRYIFFWLNKFSLEDLYFISMFSNFRVLTDPEECTVPVQEEFAMSSPHHTRSGRVYTGWPCWWKKTPEWLWSSGSASSRRRRGKRKLVREVEGDIADCEEEFEERDRLGVSSIFMVGIISWWRLPAVERCLRTGYRATVQVNQPLWA